MTDPIFGESTCRRGEPARDTVPGAARGRALVSATLAKGLPASPLFRLLLRHRKSRCWSSDDLPRLTGRAIHAAGDKHKRVSNPRSADSPPICARATARRRRGQRAPQLGLAGLELPLGLGPAPLRLVGDLEALVHGLDQLLVGLPYRLDVEDAALDLLADLLVGPAQ